MKFQNIDIVVGSVLQVYIQFIENRYKRTNVGIYSIEISGPTICIPPRFCFILPSGSQMLPLPSPVCVGIFSGVVRAPMDNMYSSPVFLVSRIVQRSTHIERL